MEAHRRSPSFNPAAKSQFTTAVGLSERSLRARLPSLLPSYPGRPTTTNLIISLVRRSFVRGKGLNEAGCSLARGEAS